MNEQVNLLAFQAERRLLEDLAKLLNCKPVEVPTKMQDLITEVKRLRELRDSLQKQVDDKYES